MRITKARLYLAGLLAVLIGMPLSERAFGQVGDIVDASFGLARAIAESAGRS